MLVENQSEKLETFDTIYFCGKSHFEDDGPQNYLVFQTIHGYFKTVRTNDRKIVNIYIFYEMERNVNIS